MPKGSMKFPKRLDFWATPGMRMQVVALSYLRGEAGKHASICRMLLERALKEELAEMTENERREFDFILTRVRMAEGITDKVEL